MKKLLAIVLCIAMIASISVTAFAEKDPPETKAVEKPTLWPVQQQANHFYTALIQYDVLSNVAGLAKGFTTAYPKLVAKASTGMGLLKDIFQAWNTTSIFDPDTGKLVPPTAVPNLNYALAQVWWALGTAFVGDFKADLTNKSDGTITGAIAAAEAAIPTVSAPAGWIA